MIIKNFFGRMKKLRGYMEQTFRLSPNKYELFFKMCVGLTNYHISLMPLRRDDGKVERNYERRLLDEKAKAEAKKKAQRENDRALRRARTQATARAVAEDEDLLEIGDSDEWSHSNQEEDPDE